MNFAKCENCGSRTCFRVLEDLVPMCVNITHLKKNHTSFSQTLYKFVPSETEKVQIGNNQEMAHSERNSHSINRGVGKTKMTLRYLYHENML